MSEWRDKHGDTHSLLVQSREAEKTLQMRLDGVNQQLREALGRIEESTNNINNQNEVCGTVCQFSCLLLLEHFSFLKNSDLHMIALA